MSTEQQSDLKVNGVCKLLHVRAENVKGLQLAEVDVNRRGVTIVGGHNGQGKSSFLDSVCMALGGKSMFPPEPIRDGEDEAEIEVQLSGGVPALPWPCTVRRTISRKDDGAAYTTKVEIISEDGDKSSSPQGILDQIIGGLGFDPLAFVSEPPRKQVDILRSLVGIDFAEIDVKRDKLYSARTEVNRVAKQLDGKLKQTPMHYDVPEDFVSVAELMNRLRDTEEHNRRAAATHGALESARRRQDQIREQLSRLQKEFEELVQNIDLLEAEPLEPMDTQSIKQQIIDSEMINDRIRENKSHVDLIQQRKAKEAESRQLTKEIEKIDKTKARMLAEARWPVEGLGFGPDGVVYQGTPFVQLASSEQLEISVAIALSLNPEFPFAIVRAGSLLDDDGLVELAKIVARHNGQCFVERVSTGPECHVVFEEGRRAK